ncbi:MAG: TraR/DksA family transcriptional regulator [Streptosporangiaceae bacterium]
MTGDLAALLGDRRAGLEAELASLTTQAGEHGQISFGKRVGEGTSVAVERLSQVAAHDRLRAMLAQVTRAQAKMTEGTYGACDGCGVTIAPERLEALPWATRCVGCAAKG